MRFWLLLALIAFGLASTACAQSRLIRRCQGSANYARVEVSRQGDVTILPCPNRSLTINGVAQPKRYVALLSYDGANPVATVIENTLGTTIAWSKASDGVYNATAGSAVFTANKTLYNSGSVAYDAAIYGMVPGTTSTFQFIALSSSGGTPVNLARAVVVEIEVYP